MLDENPGITAEKASFERAFHQTHAGVITYVPNAIVEHIDPGTRTVMTTMGPFSGRVINPIPRQRAPRLLYDLGLVNAASQTDAEKRWSLVDPRTYEYLESTSSAGTTPGVHIIGDPATHGLPKAGHVANHEAKVCADAITRMLRGGAPDDNPVTNSACYSPITFETASWLTAVYRYNAAQRKMEVFTSNAGVAAAGEAESASKDNFEQMDKWFRQLMADTYA